MMESAPFSILFLRVREVGCMMRCAGGKHRRLLSSRIHDFINLIAENALKMRRVIKSYFRVVEF